MLIGKSKKTTASQQQKLDFEDLSYKKHFQELLDDIQRTNWKNHLIESIKRYSLESYKLIQLGPKNIEKLYEKVISKYKNKQEERMNWYQNELRLFIWFLATSPGIFGLATHTYSSSQLGRLVLPFFGIHHDLCEYQFKSIIGNQQFRGWENQEDSLLSEILRNHSLEGAWSSIAKQLFLKSEKKYFRTPQSCRERWQNHLDNRKVRGQWTTEEDLLLVKYIISQGKRWSVIAKKIGDTRTEHMVKNRFQTILRRQFKSKKKPVRFSEEFQFCRDLLKKLTQSLDKQSSYLGIQEGSMTPYPQLASKSIEQETFSSNSLQKKMIEAPHKYENLKQDILSSHSQCSYISSSYEPLSQYFLPNKKQQQCLVSNMVEQITFQFSNPCDKYRLTSEWIQKSFFEKIQTQIQLQVPLFLDESIYCYHAQQRIKDFFQQ